MQNLKEINQAFEVIRDDLDQVIHLMAESQEWKKPEELEDCIIEAINYEVKHFIAAWVKNKFQN